MITRKQLKRVALIWADYVGLESGEKFKVQFFKHLNKSYLGKLKKKEFDKWLDLWDKEE